MKLDEWAGILARQLKSEAELVGSRARSELYQDSARETFIRVVLEPFLPGSYAIGSGRIIDAAGRMSSPQDIVIYRRDFPQFNMPGDHTVFVYESVLATIQISAKLVRKTFFQAMDQCASMGELDPAIDTSIMRTLAGKMNMQLDARHNYVHADPLNTCRFNLIGRPQSFIYAFTGFQTSEKQLAENLGKWIDRYHEDHDALQMKSLPSVIATQGCFAWRNTTPFAIKERVLFGVGNDQAPLRLLILQLLHLLNRRLQNTSDGYGIKSNIAPYLAGFARPSFSETVGRATNPGARQAAKTSTTKTSPAGEQHETKPQAQSTTPTDNTRVQERKARTAKLVALSKRAADEKVAPTAPGTNAPGEASQMDSQHKPDQQPPVIKAAKDYSKPSVSAIPQSSRPAVDSASSTDNTAGTKAPLIQDLTPRKPEATVASTGQVTEGANRPKPSPLSMFNDDGESEVEDYHFKPIDPASVPDENAGVDIEISSSGEVEAGPGQSPQDELALAETGTTSQPADMSNEDDEEDGAFIDTLVETPEGMAKRKSESAPRKSEYVTESLI